jgi:CHASE2 domain-containing sensor protein
MKLNAPKTITWWIALILGAVGLIGSFISLPIVSGIAFWLVVVGLALLLVATAVSGV